MMNASDNFDNCIEALRQQGLHVPADWDAERLHETAWTTGAELPGELGAKIGKIAKNQ